MKSSTWPLKYINSRQLTHIYSTQVAFQIISTFDDTAKSLALVISTMVSHADSIPDIIECCSCTLTLLEQFLSANNLLLQQLHNGLTYQVCAQITIIECASNLLVHLSKILQKCPNQKKSTTIKVLTIKSSLQILHKTLINITPDVEPLFYMPIQSTEWNNILKHVEILDEIPGIDEFYRASQDSLVAAYTCISKGALSKSKSKALGYFIYYQFHKKQAVEEGNRLLNMINEQELKDIIEFQGKALKSLYDQALHPILCHKVIYAKKLLPKFKDNAFDDEDTLDDAIKAEHEFTSTFTFQKQPKE